MFNIDQDLLTKFDALRLENGAHRSREAGMCAMEAAAWLANEPHSDHPQCVSPVIGAFMRSWNDSLADDKRQMLKPYIPKILGTAATKSVEDKRAWLAMDWMVRTYLPAWLELAKLTENAEQIRALPEITSATLTATMPALKAAQQRSDAAWDAARDAARAAAWDAARAAAWDAARAAAWDAAWAAAWDAAWDAARAAAWDAAWAAAWDAARAAAWDAAWDAAWAAAWDAAWDAAWAAAWDAAWDAARAAARAAASKSLQPTVERLQTSALGLLDRMIECGRE